MNKNEKLAYDWLTSKGFTGIVFRYGATPDFITDQGDSFEVKTLFNKTILFTRKQFEHLLTLDKGTILVFSNKPEPIAVIPISELRLRPKKWQGILIQVPKVDRKIIFLHDFTDQEHALIKSAARADQRSINSWCKLALLAKIQGTKQVIDNLAPGEVAIIHKRAEKGVFVKRK